MSSEEECENISSDSNLELSDIENLDYLHEKIGIYVKDHSGSAQDKSQLVQLLPVEFGVVIVSYSDEERCDKVPGFSCTLRLSIRDKETILRWLKLFEQKTYTVWRVDSTFKCEKSKKLMFKKNFRCQNNQYSNSNKSKENTRKKRVEHTACPAKLSLTIKNYGMQRTSDTYLKEYPAVISIRFTHNHTFRTPKEYLQYANPIPLEDTPADDMCTENSEVSNKSKTKVNGSETSLGDNKKCVLTSAEWNNIICGDVFERESSSSLCFDKVSENVNNCSETILQDYVDKLCCQLKSKLIDNPEMYHLPVYNFIESFNSMKTDEQLIVALNSFGVSDNSGLDYKKEPCMNTENSSAVSVSSIVVAQSSKEYENYKSEKEDRSFVNSDSKHQYYSLS